MSGSRSLILLTREPHIATAVEAALASNGNPRLHSVCEDLVGLVGHLERETMPAVLVDIDPHPKGILAELDPIVTRFADTRFIVLSNEHRNDLVLDAMQVGARHFMVKEGIESSLPGVLDRLIPNGSTGRGTQDRVVTVLAASGGCGATTIAVNLAQELQLLTCQPSLLMDLDTSYGAIGAYLGLEGGFGVADVLLDPRRIDPQLISSSTAAYTKDFHVLLSPASVNFSQPAPLAFDHLGSLLYACRSAYPVTVIDAPRVSLDTAETLARASTVTYLVFQLTVTDIRFAGAMLSALGERGIRADKLVPLANRYQKRKWMISLQDAQKALQRTDLQCVRNDYPAAVRSLNQGQTLAQVARRSVLRRDVRELAIQVTKMRPTPTNGNGAQ